MTPANDLGRLEQITDLRDTWPSEAQAFTPWLANEDNLRLLSDTIGLDLELAATEKDVGPFRADILCKDTATNDWVLIENQLERTDHTHLGQLLTYASGLKAVTIVWIADRFTEEHRSALDWLNEITNDRFNFFGLEIELWRIGSSPIAPKLNVVCKPNDWSRTVTGATSSGAGDNDLSKTRLLQQEYWSQMRETLLDRRGVLTPQKALPQHWTNFAVGKTGFSLWAAIHIQKQFIWMGMSCYAPHGKAHFNLLQEDKEAIEKELGESVEWELLPHRKESRITLTLSNIDPADREKWPEQQEWLIKKLEKFHGVFAPRIKKLDATDYQSPGPVDGE